MIFHVNRLTLKPNLTEEQRREALDLMRQAGSANPAVRSFVVGRDPGGDFEWAAVYVVEDLDGEKQHLVAIRSEKLRRQRDANRRATHYAMLDGRIPPYCASAGHTIIDSGWS